MAAPVSAFRFGVLFRDVKGNTSKMRVLIGAATTGACITNLGTLEGHVAAATNANVGTNIDSEPDFAYGASAMYASVEDGALLTFRGPTGKLHRYKIAAPISANFNTDQETVLASATAIAAVINDFQTFVYGDPEDTAPLVYIGGVRIRRKMHRRLSIFVKDPSLGIPAE